jgi:hypothetical protein
MPNAEAIVSGYLRSVPEVSSLVGTRVYTVLPRKETDREFPLVRVSRIGGGPTEAPAYLDRALLSVEVWGGTKNEARTIAATIAGALDEIDGYSTTDGYATGSSPGALRYIEDADFEPPKARYVVDVVAYFRPS